MRRLLKILIWLFTGLLVATATLPWWLGGLLLLAKRPLGIEFGRYERIGYARFALHDAHYRRANVWVTVDSVEADTPLRWTWRHLRRAPSPLTVKGWRVEVKRGEPLPPDPDEGWMALRRQLLTIADVVGRWIPAARTEAGEVVFPGGPIGVKTANWDGRVLQFDALSWAGHAFKGAITFVSQEDLIGLRLETEQNGTQVDLESRGPKVAGRALGWEQPVTILAQFADHGWLPVEARAVAENWTLDGQKLQLGGAYALVRASGRIDWRKGGFELDLTAKGEPVPNANIPPLELAAHGHGDLETITIETLRVTIPGLEASLSEPVRVNREAQLLSGPSRLALAVDLARLPWFSAEGRVTGEARVETGHDFKPRVAVQLAAKAVKIGQWSLPQLNAAGVFDWPSLEVSQASVSFGPDETIQLSGSANLETKQVNTAKIEARLKGQTVAGWWAGAPKFDDARVTAHVEGPWAQLRHSGNAQVNGLDFPPLHPVGLSIAWDGAGYAAEKLTVEAACGEAQMALSGAVDLNGARIDAWRIQKHETTWLALAKPARLDWRPALRCEPLTMTGDAGQIELAGSAGKNGEARFQLKAFSTAWLRDWLVWRGPDWRVTEADFSGRWANAPMEFSLAAAAEADSTQQRVIRVQLKATGGQAGIKLEALQLFEGDREAVTASGNMPVTIIPAADPWWSLDSGAPLDFSATTSPDAAFWTFLAESSGLVIERPQVNLSLSGNWREPRGKIAFQLPRIAANPERFKRKMPVAEAIDGLVELDHGQIALKKLSGTIDGQRIEVEGHLPVPKEGLSELKNRSWKRLATDFAGRVQIPGAELAVLAAYVPDLMVPKGRLEADATFSEGKAHGFVRVDHAALKPLGPLGVWQDLKADLALVGRGVEIHTLEATMAGQRVTVKGSAEIKDDGSRNFDLSLKGENLPFVRQVGLLLRGDLDLKLVSTDHGGAKITGKVNLRESLFSTDVRDLVPKGGVDTATRPPFFSVDQAPFSAWQLDIDLGGERFLRLRTPVFNGVASMHFHLANTLGEPRATGEAVINEGQIMLPFTTFAIQQGSVQLTEANPYEPVLFVTGASRLYGYDLRMEISGKASAPVVMFSSSPPLESNQVLVMVMAGEVPNSEVTYTSGQRAARFGAFIGGNLVSSVSGNSDAAGRLSISSGENVTTAGRETYTIEYRLNPRWSLVGEYDEFDCYNAGVKWRVLTDKRTEEKHDAK